MIETIQFTVGRSAGCDYRISHPTVSRAHLKVFCSGDSVLIEDLNSQFGTFVLVDGEYKRIRSAKIHLDTVIRLGDSLEAMEIGELIESFHSAKKKEKGDILKRVKSQGLKRCFECGSVLFIEKIYCDCCGAILEESA